MTMIKAKGLDAFIKEVVKTEKAGGKVSTNLRALHLNPIARAMTTIKVEDATGAIHKVKTAGLVALITKLTDAGIEIVGQSVYGSFSKAFGRASFMLPIIKPIVEELVEVVSDVVEDVVEVVVEVVVEEVAELVEDATEAVSDFAEKILDKDLDGDGDIAGVKVEEAPKAKRKAKSKK